jgi:hypothetical protein
MPPPGHAAVSVPAQGAVHGRASMRDKSFNEERRRGTPNAHSGDGFIIY